MFHLLSLILGLRQAILKAVRLKWSHQKRARKNCSGPENPSDQLLQKLALPVML